jgi:hypothetical protein
MNATNQTHPAESPEFLSRLQDGELSPPEAVSFEEHRRGCARCHEAADSYARALSIFRSASPRPAPSDLSARILRKVRAQAPSRRPFGVTFGIDVRWAGVCAAALVVVIMAASILDEGPAPSIVLPPPPSEPASVRAHLLDKEIAPAERADKKARRAESAGAPSSPAPARPAPPAAAGEIGQGRDSLAAASPGPPSNLARQEPAPSSAAPQAGAVTQPAAPGAGVVRSEAPAVDATRSEEAHLPADRANAAPAPAATEKDSGAATIAPEARYQAKPDGEAQKTAALAAPSSRARAYAEAPGGEGGTPGSAGDGVRLIVEAADGLGGAPALERGADDAGLSAFRGREFVLVVESGGRVRSAAVRGESGSLRNLRENADTSASAKAKDERESLSPLLELRFAPGERPRRLRVRIE